MSSNLQYRVPHTADSDVKVANSHFCDDEWDLAPLFSQSSISPNYKKLRFDDIRNEKLKLITKQYLYYKLGQIKARTVVAVRYRLNHFIRFCEIHNIESLKHITSRTLITFAVWLKTEHNLNPITGHFISYTVEEMIRIGQIKGWEVPDGDVLTGATARDLWGRRTDEQFAKKVQPIPDEIFDKIMQCAVNYTSRNTNDVLTKCGIIIQSQTGLRIGEVLSIKSGCLHQPKGSPAYFEVALSKTVKGEPILHQVFANDLVVNAIMELEESTAQLRAKSGKQELFLTNNHGINVSSAFRWTSNRLKTFIRDCDIRGADGELYPLKSHQFRATFVKQLIMRKIPIAYVMKQYSHVSAEMTCYYLTLQEREIKQLYAQMLFSPDAKIAGMFADELKAKTLTMFRGKTECDIENVIDHLSESISFNPLPGGVCLYDYRRGNCSNGDGCFFYNCPNFITEVSFLPVLRKELKLMEQEMARTKRLGYERQWQIQHSRYLQLKPLVEKLEGDTNG